MHVLIVGMTESGKTTLATRLAQRYKAQGWKVAVLDPMYDNRWGADYQTTDGAAFLATLRQSRRCMVFVDESGSAIGRFNDEMFWLGTQARHWGHSCHFLTQRAQMLSPTVRTQVQRLFLFNCSAVDAKLLADEWNRPELREAHQLGRGEYYDVPRFGPARRGRLTFHGET